jgi:hypothetical protein
MAHPCCAVGAAITSVEVKVDCCCCVVVVELRNFKVLFALPKYVLSLFP